MRNVTHELKFADPLPNLVLDGTKYKTWRLNNEKDIRGGDGANLLHSPTLRLFAMVAITGVVERTFETLRPEDLEGHEPFASRGEMLRTYTGYYRMEVTPQTRLTVITFEPWLIAGPPGAEEPTVFVRHNEPARVSG